MTSSSATRRVLSLSPLSLLPANPVEQIDAAHTAGFDAVGLRLQPVLPTDIDILGDPALMRAIERRLADTGLRVLDLEVFRVGPATDVRAFVPAMEFGRSLGAEFLLCTSVLKSEHVAADEPRTVERWVELCETGARLGVKPMLEFMIYRSVGTLVDALRLVERVQHPNLAVCVDALHLSRSGGTPDDVRRVDPRLLCCAQLCDAPAAIPRADEIPLEARYHRLHPGEGGLPLADLLDALPARCPLSLEVPDSRAKGLTPRDHAAAIARWTRRLLDAGR